MELPAVMGADMLGRFRTGAAWAVATKHLLRSSEFSLALCGAGKQGLFSWDRAIEDVANDLASKLGGLRDSDFGF